MHLYSSSGPGSLTNLLAGFRKKLSEKKKHGSQVDVQNKFLKWGIQWHAVISYGNRLDWIIWTLSFV